MHQNLTRKIGVNKESTELTRIADTFTEASWSVASDTAAGTHESWKAISGRTRLMSLGSRRKQPHNENGLIDSDKLWS